MKNYNALIVFSIIGVIAYAVVAYLVVMPGAAFAYYPSVNEFHLTPNYSPQPKSAGPAMYYYGWKVSAAIIALIGAFIIPKLWKSPKVLPVLTVAAAALVLLYTLYFERNWFL